MIAALLLSVGLLVWSLVANLRWGDRWYVTRSLVAAVVLVGVGVALGFEPATLGLDPVAAGDGLRWGRIAVVAVMVAVSLAAGLADRLPWVGALLADRRADLPFDRLVHAVLVRVPFGTAAFEEVAFRGVLLTAWLQVVPTPRAMLWSSVVFGLWHVAPTIVTLRTNRITVRSRRAIGLLAAAMVVTTGAGLVLAWLRVGSGSLVAPWLAHWAVNAAGLLAAAVTRRTGGIAA